MKFVVRIADTEKTVVVVENNGHYDIEIDGKPYQVDCRYFGDRDFLSLLIDNKSYLIESAPVNAADGRYYARVMGRHYDVDVLDELLVAVHVQHGGEVFGGQLLRGGGLEFLLERVELLALQPQTCCACVSPEGD